MTARPFLCKGQVQLQGGSDGQLTPVLGFLQWRCILAAPILACAYPGCLLHVLSCPVYMQASSGALPSFAAQGGYLDLSPPNSNTLLPVLDVEEASDVQPAATLHQQQQPQQLQQDAARGSGPDVPPGYNSQPLPAFMTNSFSFYRRTGPSRLSADLQCCSREGSNSNKSGTSSGKLPTFLQSLRQGSFSMRDVSFSSSARQGSQTGSIIGDHAWFV